MQSLKETWRSKAEIKASDVNQVWPITACHEDFKITHVHFKLTHIPYHILCLKLAEPR